jgi:CHASE2 domain-containing sensor protein
MNQAVHQLIQLILQGLTWFLRTIETLWVWSWSQISGVFSTPWDSLPGWKIALALIAVVVLAGLLLAMIRRGLAALGEIAAAFWTMALTMFGVLSFIVIAGLFSRGFQWVVASVPDDFWQRLM